MPKTPNPYESTYRDDAGTLAKPESKTGGLVSIITRTKNRPLLLRRALLSIASQTYENWELIVVNDGGPIEPVIAEVSKLEEAKKCKIKTIHHEVSLGMERASNAALERASGEFFVVHDDDDAWDSEFLETTTNFLDTRTNQRYVAVTTNCTVIKEVIDQEQVEEVSREPWAMWSDRISLQELVVHNTIPTISLVVRSSALQLLKNFNGDLPVLGDWDFNLRLLLIGDIGTINRPLARYHQRIHSAGDNQNSISSGTETHLEYWNRYRNHLIRNATTQDSSTLGLLNALLTQINNNQTTALQKIQNNQNEILSHLEIKQTSLLQTLERLEIHLQNTRQQDNDYLRAEFSSVKSKIERSSLFSIMTHKLARNIRSMLKQQRKP